MKLMPIDNSMLALVAEWMTKKENYQWLDFGSGVQILTAASLKIMAQRDIHLLRVFTAGADDAPIGLAGLSNIDRHFKTATLWYVLGNKSHGGKGCATAAVSKLLTLGFTELGLCAVNAWAVEKNAPSIRVLQRNNFQLAGRLRQCHYIDGVPYDHLLFDLLAAEHKEMAPASPAVFIQECWQSFHKS